MFLTRTTVAAAADAADARGATAVRHNEMKLTHLRLKQRIEDASNSGGVAVDQGGTEQAGAEGDFMNKSTVSKQSTCAAVMGLIQICDCPTTRERLAAACAEIMDDN